jgi:hypothetical protein
VLIFSPTCSWMVVCSVVCVCFVLGLLCGGVASACYVPLLFFLYDIAVLLLLFFKKIYILVIIGRICS